ncbi:ribonuclease H-like domain-containing protein [Tanacetum coccineum]
MNIIAELEASGDYEEVFDLVMELRDDRHDEQDKVADFNRLIVVAEEKIHGKEIDLKMLEAEGNDGLLSVGFLIRKMSDLGLSIREEYFDEADIREEWTNNIQMGMISRENRLCYEDFSRRYGSPRYRFEDSILEEGEISCSLKWAVHKTVYQHIHGTRKETEDRSKKELERIDIRNRCMTIVLVYRKREVMAREWEVELHTEADGKLSRYKARVMVNGSTQLEGIDVDETFSLVFKPITIRTVLSLATSRHLPIHQLDVKNAFLHAVSLWAQAGPSSLGMDTTNLLLYVDDIVLTAFSELLLQQIIRMFLSQRKYVVEILERAHMVGCNPSRTPVAIESKLGDDGDPVSNPTLYRCLAALKRILWYVRGTLDYGLQLFASFTTSLIAYSDTDSAGCPTTQRSISGYCLFLGNNLLSWSSKRQPTLSRSSAEAEYRGVANAVAETCWLRTLVRELHTPLSFATLVYCDNRLVVARQVRVLHVPSRYQYADIFTKGLPSALCEEFRTSLSVRYPPALTAGEC